MGGYPKSDRLRSCRRRPKVTDRLSLFRATAGYFFLILGTYMRGARIRAGGRAGGRTGGRASARLHGRAGGQTGKRARGRTSGRTSRRMDERAGGRADGRTNERANRRADGRTSLHEHPWDRALVVHVFFEGRRLFNAAQIHCGDRSHVTEILALMHLQRCTQGD